MKWFISLKEKRRAAMVLFAVLAVILLNLFLNSKDYDRLDKNMSSIYNDRLMPAGYLFKISDHLYQKQLLHMDDRIKDDELTKQLSQHDLRIAELIKFYEATYLTKAEQRHWNSFLHSLDEYQTVELSSTKAVFDATKLKISFNHAQVALNQLNAIQAEEGDMLQRSSKAIISETVLHAYLEITMIIILAVIVLMLLAGNETPFFPLDKKHILN